MWGFKGFPTADAKLARWLLAADDICFKNRVLSYFFGLVAYISRGKSVTTNCTNKKIEVGDCQSYCSGPCDPIVLPIVHHGLQEVMPENYKHDRRSPFPLWNKEINIIVGDPIEFDLPTLREMAVSMSKGSSPFSSGWLSTTHCGLNEAAQKCLYSSISDRIRTVMENLRTFGKTCLKSNC